MPAPLSCGKLVHMKTLAAALTALAVAAPAASAVEFPGNESPRCTFELAAKMKRKAALSSGIPVAVTCDAPASVASILIVESRNQRTRWENLHNHGIPGISKSDILTFEAAGTQTLRVNILPKRFFSRYAKTRFRVVLGVQRKPPYYTSVDSGKVIAVLR
jgi:hypothetical protein